MSQLTELLKIRDFRYLWTAQIASDFGDNLTALSLLILIQRQRVGGALSVLISGANVLSMGVAGVAAAAIGIRNVFVISGVIAIVAGILAGLLLRGVDVRSEPAPVPETV